MHEKSPESYAIATYLWVFGLAMLGGLVSFMKRLVKGRKWRTGEFIGEIAASAFAGVLAFYVCEYIGISQVASAAIVGIAGHSSSKVITLLEGATTEILNRFGKK